MKPSNYHKRGGFSLMELLAVVTILGIIAAIIVPRVSVSSDTAKEKVNAHNKATINAAVERYYIEQGDWPAADLSDIGADEDYFPDGIPENPVSGGAYTLGDDHRVAD
jgi:general secretion pathway protein G